MAAEVEIEVAFDEGVVVVAPQGRVTFEALLEVFESVYADPKIEGPLAVLLDARNGGLAPRRDQIEQMSEYFLRRADFYTPRRALVVRSRLLYGLGRMASAFEDDRGTKMQVFRDMTEALAWLRRPAD